MSEIKVNKISPKTACGTTTLGDSGDTFTIPAGVTITNNGTQTGFGRTGTVNWQTSIKTGDFTAVSGEGYFVNTTSGGITVTLPSSPSAGSIVAFKDYANTWDSNAVVLNRNGSNIGGVAQNASLGTESQSVTLIYADSTKGWLDIHDSTSNVTGGTFITATGGTITTSGNDKVHIFTGPGTFCVSQISNVAANNEVSYVVIGGGGGGGGEVSHGGGGGAGGYRETKSPITPYTASPLDGQPSAPNRITVTATGFPITVGGGGARATSGANSIFSSITGAGGGRGHGNASASAGGSGGGGTYNSAGAAGNTPPVSPSQGNPGGTSCTGANNYGAGGGGGAIAAGAAGSPTAGGAGGAGTSSEITGTPVARAGGGGGSSYQGGGPNPGGTGGGGNGSIGGPAPNSADATAGTVNTGGGGGGGERSTPGTAGGFPGGSGIVIIRYKFQ